VVLALEADGAVGHHGAVDEGGRGFGEVGGGEFVERVRAEGGGEVDGFAEGVGGEVPGEDAGGLGVCYGVSGGFVMRIDELNSRELEQFFVCKSGMLVKDLLAFPVVVLVGGEHHVGRVEGEVVELRVAWKSVRRDVHC
jgi:hypothetical protein